jgi:hypothetical protein
MRTTGLRCDELIVATSGYGKQVCASWLWTKRISAAIVQRFAYRDAVRGDLVITKETTWSLSIPAHSSGLRSPHFGA